MKIKKNNLIRYQDIDSLNYNEIFDLYKNHINPSRVGLLSTFGSGRVLVKSAKGSKILLNNGKSILDLTGGFGVLNHGHNHPRILKARAWTQKKQKMEVNKAFLSPALATLSNNITCLLPKNLNYAFFPNSGSESIDVSMRLAFKFHNNKRNKILCSDRAFHGKSLGPQSISKSGENPFTVNTLLDVSFFRFNDYESLEKCIKNSIKNNESNIAAIVLEPFSASTMSECSIDFLKKTREISKKYKIILIFDEVYTGFFKTGPFFNFMRCNDLSPDILCFAKSLGGGKSSIAGVVYSKEINDKCLSGVSGANYLSSTYYGFYEECITAIEAIQIAIDDDYEKKAKDYHNFMEKLSTKISKISDGKIILKGSGLFWGLFYEKNFKLANNLLSLIPKRILNDTGLIKKIFLASAVNWLFEKKGILSALSFGFNTHLIFSLNFKFTKKDLYLLEKAILELARGNWVSFIPKFILNRLIKP